MRIRLLCTLVFLVTVVVVTASASAPAAQALPQFDATVYPVQTGANVAAVAAADVNGDKRPDVLTADAGDDTVDVMLAGADGQLGAPASCNVGHAPTALDLGDVDGDGHQDVVVASAADHVVSVLLGDGSGLFGAPADFATGAGPEAVTLADVDDDGDLDIVTADATDGAVSVLLGDGGGGFAPAAHYAAGAGARSVIAADVDEDGVLDLVTGDKGAGTFSVLPGEGDGTFSAAVAHTALLVGSDHQEPGDVAAADMDGDGHLDVVVSDPYSGFIAISLGDGAGSFASPRSWQAFPFRLLVDDINGDGRQDVIATGGTVNIRLGAGGGRLFATDRIDAGTVTTFAWAYDAAIADMDGDGLKDVVTANGTFGTVSVLRNTGAHPFEYRGDCRIAGEYLAGASAVAAVDLDEDGRLDVAGAVYSGINVALGSGNGLFDQGEESWPSPPPVTAYPVPFTESTSYSLVTGDFNGDHHQDVVAGYAAGIAFLAGDGKGHLGTAIKSGASTESWTPWVAKGDFDKDGVLDIASTPAEGGGVDVYLGTGDGAFVFKQTVAAVNGAPYSVLAAPLTAADLDKDGDDDVLVGGGGSLCVALSNGDGSFAPATTYSAGTFSTSPVFFPEFVFVRDFTGDGKLDALMASAGPAVALRAGNGDGTLGGLMTLTNSPYTDGVPTVGDFNTDGRPDLAYTVNSLGDATILLNQGGGSFLQARCRVFEQSRSGQAAAAGDFNGDGKADVAFTDGVALHTLLGSGEVPLAATFQLDGGAARTASLTMSIDSQAVGAAQMRFSSKAGEWTAWQPYADQATFAASAGDGQRTIRVQYRSAAGDVLELSHTVTVDTKGPGITWGHSEVWNDGYTEIWIVTGDAGSGTNSGLARIEYRLDGGQWQTAARRNSLDYYYYAYMGEGQHTFEFRCYDALGNMSGPITSIIRVDGSPPVTTQTGADDRWHDGDVTVTFDAVDAGVGVARTEYSLDGGAAWTTGTSVTIYAHPDPAVPAQVGGEGRHTIQYRSVDSFGHTEVAKSCAVRISYDTTPPVVHQTGADGRWHNAPVRLTFNGTDAQTAVAGYEYSLDGGVTWSPGQNVTIGTPGVTTVLYRAFDDIGNVSEPRSCRVLLDLTRPVPGGGARISVRRGRTVKLPYRVVDTAGQSRDRVTLRILDARGKAVASKVVDPVTINTGLTWAYRCRLRAGKYTMTVTAVDAAGNKGARVAKNWLTVR